jgi:hypothetical protein
MNASAYEICFSAWAPGARPVQGNISIVSNTTGGLLAQFSSNAQLEPGVFRLSSLFGSELSSCERRGLTSLGFPSLTVNERCGAKETTKTNLIIQV